MLGSLATTSVLCWLTNARLVRKLHGSIYFSLLWLKLITEYKWLLTYLNLHQKSCCSSFNHYHSVRILPFHYDDVIMTMLASQITSLTVVYSIVYSGVNQRKHQSSASLAFVWEIHRGPVNFPHKWPVTRKMLPFDDVIMSMIKTSLATTIHGQPLYNRPYWRTKWHRGIERNPHSQKRIKHQKPFRCSRSMSYYPQAIVGELNTLKPRQNGRHFPDDIFKCIFLNENV